MRLLSEWADHDDEGAAGPESKSDRCGDPGGDECDIVPLHDVLPHPRRHQACRQVGCGCPSGFGQGGGCMTTFTNIPKQIKETMEKWNGTTSRRDFLKGSGLFVVS